MTDLEVRPFRIDDVPEEDLVDLRRRIADTQWPEKETVADESQGVPLATMQELARYWATDYDWRKCEAKLNALPQFITEIDGLDIHFIHVRSEHEDALPLIVTHGWPGSIIEQLKILGPLTDPTAHGGSAEDAFDVVIPSMPGYGFSGKPTSTGWGPERIARAWAQLMKRLGYSRYVAQGGDWGAFVVDQMGLQAPADCSPSTPTCLPPFQLTSTRLSRPANRRHPVSRPTKDAPTSNWRELSSKSSTPSTWRRARKPCTASRIHPSAWPPGFWTTMMLTASRPRRSPRL
jgi:pimeloyl-ACP methyl ester carboxylesterase